MEVGLLTFQSLKCYCIEVDVEHRPIISFAESDIRVGQFQTNRPGTEKFQTRRLTS